MVSMVVMEHLMEDRAPAPERLRRSASAEESLLSASAMLVSDDEDDLPFGAAELACVGGHPSPKGRWMPRRRLLRALKPPIDLDLPTSLTLRA